MSIGIGDVTVIMAKTMMPVYQSQVDYENRRINRYRLMGYADPNSPGHFFYKSACLGLEAAKFDLNLARKVVRNNEQRKAESTGIQDAEAVVSDQGQPEGSSVSKGEETVPDSDQGTDS